MALRDAGAAGFGGAGIQGPPLSARRRPVRPALAPLSWPVLGAVAAGCVVIAAVIVRAMHGAVIDDAWITYRYAANLAHGHGWVYDLHRHTADAATAPLYTLALAGLSWVVGSVPRAGTVIYAASLAGSGFLAYVLAARRKLPVAGVASALFLVTSPLLADTRGMETALFVCVALATAVCYDAGWLGWAGAAVAVLTCIRGDGAVLAALLFVLLVARDRRIPWRYLAGGAGVAAAWTVVAIPVIGSVLPATLGAKVAQARSGFWGTGWLFLSGARQFPETFGFSTWTYWLAALAAIGLVVVATSRAARHAAGPTVLFGAVVFVVYAFVLNPPGYGWYYAVPMLGVVLLAGHGAGWLATFGWRQRHVLPVLAGAAALVGTSWVGATEGPSSFGPAVYLTTGTWLRQHTPPTASVAATEIGIIGWFSQRDMIDYVGLLSTTAAHDLEHHDLVSWLAREQPGYWVVHLPVWGFESPASAQPWFALAYRPVWWSGGVVVWQRSRPIARAEALAASTVGAQAGQVIAAVGAARTPAATGAVTALLGVLGQRPDLQRLFVTHPRPGEDLVDPERLLTWAATAGSGADPAEAALAPHAPALLALAHSGHDQPVDVTATIGALAGPA